MPLIVYLFNEQAIVTLLRLVPTYAMLPKIHISLWSFVSAFLSYGVREEGVKISCFIESAESGEIELLFMYFINYGFIEI